MRKLGMAGCAVVLSLWCHHPAVAGSATGINPVLDNCQNPKIDKDARVAACDSLIHSNLANGKMLGVFYALRGQAYLAKDDATDAMQDYNAALDHFPDLPEALINRGQLFHQQHQYDQALADFDHAVQVKPSDGKAWFGRCYERAELNKDIEGALNDCSQALRLEPGNLSISFMRGIIYSRLDRCADAIGDFSAVIAAKPDNAAAYHNRGICKGKIGDAAGAKADLETEQSLKGARSSEPLQGR